MSGGGEGQEPLPSDLLNIVAGQPAEDQIITFLAELALPANDDPPPMSDELRQQIGSGDTITNLVGE